MHPPPGENEYWTDEGIFMSLLDFKNGKSLPSNVEFEVNPFLYRPEDLPGDLWYFRVETAVKKESEFGYWAETGDPCEIFSNSAINGFRTTLRFYEGRVPHGRKTDWVMQEYSITEKCRNSVKDHTTLCRVFLAVEDPSEMDCILAGDYFELNDLIDNHGSSSSSSANSSCLTMTSDEYFDSIALLQHLEDDGKVKDSTVRFNLSAPVNSKIVICPDTSVSIRNETSEIKEVAMNESTSSGVDTRTESSGGSKGTSKKGKKEGVGRTKRPKMMKYLCFFSF